MKVINNFITVGGQVAVKVIISDGSQVGVKVINNFITVGGQVAVKVIISDGSQVGVKVINKFYLRRDPGIGVKVNSFLVAGNI